MMELTTKPSLPPSVRPHEPFHMHLSELLRQAGKDFEQGLEQALATRDASIKALLAEDEDSEAGTNGGGAPRGSVDSSEGASRLVLPPLGAPGQRQA